MWPSRATLVVFHRHDGRDTHWVPAACGGRLNGAAANGVSVRQRDAA